MMPPAQSPVAVDPNAVIQHLRQAHAQQLDAATYQIATLQAALADAQATVTELRIRAEELGNENMSLRQQLIDLGSAEATDQPRITAASA